MQNVDKYFYKSQADFARDNSPLKLVLKSRQTGFTFVNAFRLVLLVSAKNAKHDAFISSRDLASAKLFIQDCLHWAKILHQGARSLGETLFDRDSGTNAYVLEFANGKRIYSLSSNPNALAGKRGHVTLDEFALHEDARTLFSVAKPVTTWGGEFTIISTHRGYNTLFAQLIRDVTEGSNPMGWSLHTVPIQKAVDEGIVERINKKTGRNETREAFLKRLRAECVDEESWLQEYCCTPADLESAFFSHDLLDAATDRNLQLWSLDDLCAELQFRQSHEYQEWLQSSANQASDAAPSLIGNRKSAFANNSSSQLSTKNPQLFLGLDIARVRNLAVIDVGEKIGSVTYDRLRIEIHNKPFEEIRAPLWRLLKLPQITRACIDASGMGIELAEDARRDFGYKVEPITFTPALKEEMAFALRRELEDSHLRIPNDPALRADFRALKKEVTPNGKLRFIGQVENSHCDRTWAKALRQHAARRRFSAGAMLV
jgi:phage FluMu gp28-like protein